MTAENTWKDGCKPVGNDLAAGNPKTTGSLQVENAPYCPIPENYFERRIAMSTSTILSMATIEPWAMAQLSDTRK